jgi:sodium/potassium-transporting ATPase subunit alpha
LIEFANPFALLLWAGAILAFVAYILTPNDPSNLYLGIVLVVVISTVAFLSFYENMKSEAIMSSFKDFIPPSTIVIRDGVEKPLESAKLVVGDVIKI